MQCFGALKLWALLACILIHGSVASDHLATHPQRWHQRKVVVDNGDSARPRDGLLDKGIPQLKQLQSSLETYEGWIKDWMAQQDQTISPPLQQLTHDLHTFQDSLRAVLSHATGDVMPPSLHGPSTPTSLQSTLHSPSLQPSEEPSGPSIEDSLARKARKPAAAAPQQLVQQSVPEKLAPRDLYSSPQIPQAPQPADHSAASSGQKLPAIRPNANVASSVKLVKTVFDPHANDNVAVYWGATSASAKVTLMQLCANPNVNIVNIAFLTHLVSGGGYPEIQFSAGCSGQTPEQQAQKASGLAWCPQIAMAIRQCQNEGKIVMLSIGGATSAGYVDFSSAEEADLAALMLWSLFGAGTGESAGLRPFGTVAVDGFDIDTEDQHPAYWPNFVATLRELMQSYTSSNKNHRQFYLSGAPQCPIPDASISTDTLTSLDFVWVQFYNNGYCDVNEASTFPENFQQWSQLLSQNGGFPRLYIGAPGCPECAGRGYTPPAEFKQVIRDAQGKASNMGGVMLWDGPRARQNVNNGQDYLAVAKQALTS